MVCVCVVYGVLFSLCGLCMCSLWCPVEFMWFVYGSFCCPVEFMWFVYV